MIVTKIVIMAKNIISDCDKKGKTSKYYYINGRQSQWKVIDSNAL